MFDASASVAEVRQLLSSRPGILAGSAVAAEAHALPFAYSDIDVFTPTMEACVSNVQVLLNHGATMDERFSRVWSRWLRYGVGRFHTNSMRVNTPSGIEINVVHKKVNGSPLTSASSVIESFDFGLLAAAYDLHTNTFYDYRQALFPRHQPSDALPLMPNKRADWRQGFVSQYNGLRQMQRYVKYLGYGYDMAAVKDDLITGYREASLYWSNVHDADKRILGTIYSTIADYIEDDKVDEMKAAAKKVDYDDDLDAIMKALI